MRRLRFVIAITLGLLALHATSMPCTDAAPRACLD